MTSFSYTLITIPNLRPDDIGPIHTIRHVSVPSSFSLHSVRLICVHTVCRVQSPSGIARDRRPALISIKYNIIYLLTAIGLSPGGSSTVHIYTQTIHRTTQNKQYIEQHNNLGECRPCPVLARFTLAFALQLRKKHEKTAVRVAASKNT